MPRRSLLSRAARDAFFGIPSEMSAITRTYVLGPEDLNLRGAAPQTNLVLPFTSLFCAIPGSDGAMGSVCLRP
jgi:hypothetical protein